MWTCLRGLHDRGDKIIYEFMTSANLCSVNWDGFVPESVVEPSRNANGPLQSANLHLFCTT